MKNCLDAHTLHFSIFALMLSILPALSQSGSATLSSPDGRLAISFLTTSSNQPAANGGKLVYSVTFQSKPLVERSALRLELEGQKPLGAEVRFVNSALSKTDQTYHLVTGKTSTVRDHHNALSLELEERSEPGRKLVVQARAYDDAVAFRYLVPEQAGLSDFRLTNEDTEFRIAKDATVYALVLPDYRSMYESEFIKLPACVHVPLAVVFLVLPPLMYFVPDRRVEAGTSE